MENITDTQKETAENVKVEIKTKKAKPQSFTPVLGFDPKNRAVQLTKRKELYYVTKQATGFKSKGNKDLTKAKAIYDFQIICSQNQ